MKTEHIEIAIILAGALTGSEAMALLPIRPNSWVELVVAIIQGAAGSIRQQQRRIRGRR